MARLGVPAGGTTTVARAQMSAKRAAVSAGGRASLTQGLTRRPCPRRARTCAKSTKDVESKAEDAEGEQVGDAIAPGGEPGRLVVPHGWFQRHAAAGGGSNRLDRARCHL